MNATAVINIVIINAGADVLAAAVSRLVNFENGADVSSLHVSPVAAAHVFLKTLPPELPEQLLLAKILTLTLFPSAACATLELRYTAELIVVPLPANTLHISPT